MKTVESCASNFDGEFIVNVPKGSYTIVVWYLGYLSDTIAETHYDADTMLAPIRLVVNSDIKLEAIEVEEHNMVGVIDEEYFQANPAWQKFEKEGVKVIVR